MTKEELKEAIAATITENGQKGITGQALANLLNEIVDAAGEGGGGSGLILNTVLNLDETNLSITVISEPNEANAQVYQKIREGAKNGIAYPVIVFIDASSMADGAWFNDMAFSILPSEDFTYLEIWTYYTEMLGMSNLSLYEDGSVSSVLSQS